MGLGATVLSFRWKDGVWEQQLLYGLPITLALGSVWSRCSSTGLALIPYQFPNSYYLWVGLVVLALVVGIIGWRGFATGAGLSRCCRCCCPRPWPAP